MNIKKLDVLKEWVVIFLIFSFLSGFILSSVINDSTPIDYSTDNEMIGISAPKSRLSTGTGLDSVLINEYADGASWNSGYFLELYNPTNETISLEGYKILANGTDLAPTFVPSTTLFFSFPTESQIPTNGFVVVALQSAVTGGQDNFSDIYGVNPDYQLVNSTSSVQLLLPSNGNYSIGLFPSHAGGSIYLYDSSDVLMDGLAWGTYNRTSANDSASPGPFPGIFSGAATLSLERKTLAPIQMTTGPVNQNLSAAFSLLDHPTPGFQHNLSLSAFTTFNPVIASPIYSMGLSLYPLTITAGTSINLSISPINAGNTSEPQPKSTVLAVYRTYDKLTSSIVPLTKLGGGQNYTGSISTSALRGSYLLSISVQRDDWYSYNNYILLEVVGDTTHYAVIDNRSTLDLMAEEGWGYQDVIRSRGNIIVKFLSEPISNLSLANTSLVVLPPPQISTSYSEDELGALHNFVSDGGKLWILGGATTPLWNVTATNSLAENWNVSFLGSNTVVTATDEITKVDDVLVTEFTAFFPPHPVLVGVSSFAANGTSLQVNYPETSNVTIVAVGNSENMSLKGNSSIRGYDIQFLAVWSNSSNRATVVFDSSSDHLLRSKTYANSSHNGSRLVTNIIGLLLGNTSLTSAPQGIVGFDSIWIEEGLVAEMPFKVKAVVSSTLRIRTVEVLLFIGSNISSISYPMDHFGDYYSHTWATAQITAPESFRTITIQLLATDSYGNEILSNKVMLMVNKNASSTQQGSYDFFPIRTTTRSVDTHLLSLFIVLIPIGVLRKINRSLP
ncbi:MAG TPA: lamin tail domain-containing protein [Candidatus Hodarchaeales archaeon]|nr:lamin tail domain-containing protein [Candidatus Hodarchaeales archaeon]